jgi:hypothetical protein
MAQNWGESLVAFVSGASGVSIVSYAARTFPMPSNPYAAWVVRVIQYAVGNPDKAQEKATQEPPKP